MEETKIFRAVFAGEIESVKGSERTDLQSGDAVDGVVDGTGGAGEVKDVSQLCRQSNGSQISISQEFESRIVAQMIEIGAAAGEQIVDGDNVAFAEKRIAEMGSEKTGSSGDQARRRHLQSRLSLVRGFPRRRHRVGGPFGMRRRRGRRCNK